MAFIIYGVIAIVAYLLGSIPSGYLVARIRGVDIRKVGSGNIGATNVLRTLGKTAGITVLLSDALKGFIACKVSLWILAAWPNGSQAGIEDSERVMLVGGVAAILGHVYSCWMHFKGGKGIATTAGVGLAWIPWGLLIALGTWIVVVIITRFVSVASLAAAVALPIGVWIAGGSKTMIFINAMIGVLAIYKHRANIKRLMNGTEPRIDLKKKSEGGAG